MLLKNVVKKIVEETLFRILMMATFPSHLKVSASLFSFMKHEHLTIMFTDIKGFTSRTSKSSRAELEKLLELHEELIEPIFQDFGGEVIKTIGDAFMVKFKSPTDAVLCGREIQRVLKVYNKDKDEDEQIEIRVAINSGECVVKGNDVFGETVNIAARLEGIAEAGDIYFTEAVYLSMNKNEIPTAEVGYRHFKGVPDEIKVYKVLQERDTPNKRSQTLISKKKKTSGGSKSHGWFRRNWKWVALGVIILFILAAIAYNEKRTVRNPPQDLKTQALRLGREAVAAINAGDRDLASSKIESLEAISKKYGNPPELEDGIDKLWKRYDEKFGAQEKEEIKNLIDEVDTDIREGHRLKARQGLDELISWRDSGYDDLTPIIDDLEKRFAARFR